MIESVKACIDDPDTPFLTLFLIFFGETLACFLGVLVTAFFGFHVWLMMRAMTTIESARNQRRVARKSVARPLTTTVRAATSKPFSGNNRSYGSSPWRPARATA